MLVVKRRGHIQEFDERKVYASVYAACLNSHINREEAESMAALVTREVRKWIEEKHTVTSDQIFRKIGDELHHLNKDAAFMYITHRDIS